MQIRFISPRSEVPFQKNTLFGTRDCPQIQRKKRRRIPKFQSFSGNKTDSVNTKIKSVKTDVCEVYEYKNCLFVTANNYGGTISGNSLSQWQKNHIRA
ncbi:MAG: hypothetical protein L6V93_21680 [Clostridiales bacterium]|nr:MAG: hypothetical protein L6V93_21680 [Clostridiales bacterium]